MARYIDADALKLDIDLSKGASVLDMALSVIKAVTEAPAADVAPKSEVAREIFEEIYEDCFDQFGYIDYKKLAELKKKYTEEKE